jgi:hypothetical protein
MFFSGLRLRHKSPFTSLLVRLVVLLRVVLLRAVRLHQVVLLRRVVRLLAFRLTFRQHVPQRHQRLRKYALPSCDALGVCDDARG